MNPLATLMLAVNVAGIAVSFWTGDPRLMIAKDAVISSVIWGLVLLADCAARLWGALTLPVGTRG